MASTQNVFYSGLFANLPFLSAYFSLAVRDLSNLVKPEDIITSEHLVTLLAIVPKYSQKDWLVSYDKLCGKNRFLCVLIKKKYIYIYIFQFLLLQPRSSLGGW